MASRVIASKDSPTGFVLQDDFDPLAFTSKLDQLKAQVAASRASRVTMAADIEALQASLTTLDTDIAAQDLAIAEIAAFMAGK